MYSMTSFLLDSDPHSRQDFVPDVEHPQALSVVLILAIEEVRERSRHTEIDCVGCLCGKCRKPMDLFAQSRFYELHGGPHDGLRMVGHARCVKNIEAIRVSVASSVEICARQREEQEGRVKVKAKKR